MKKTIVLIAFLGSGILLMQHSFSSKKDAVGELYDKDFLNKSREEQIKVCGSCHSDVYENELAGPHYQAFLMLTEHREFVNSSKYNCSFYTKHVNKGYEDDCTRCHAADNLFETIFKNHHEADSLTRWLLAQRQPAALARNQMTSRQTGVDCLTCHFDGKGVVSGNPKFKEPSSASCNPRYSEFFSTINITCQPCHVDEYKSLSATMEANSISLTCNTCHQQYDEYGTGTHYHYWTHGPAASRNNTLLRVTEDFSIRLNREGDTSEITWLNRTLPHVIGLCPEWIIECEVMDKDSIVLGQKTVRVNRKAEHDPMMYANLDNNYLGGEEGVPAPGYLQSTAFPVAVLKPEDAAYLRVSFIKKQQYWFPDSLGTKLFSRTSKIEGSYF